MDGTTKAPASTKKPGATATATMSSNSSEAFLREQLETANKEMKLLKQRIDALEKENQQLKKSVYDLSFRTALLNRAGSFDIDVALDNSAGQHIPENVRAEIQASSVATPMTPATSTGKDKDARLFHFKHELKGHTGAVYAVQFSFCGRFVASGSFDRTVRIWEANAPQEIKRLDRHTLNVSDVVWSWDSTALLSGAYDQSAIVWDVEQGKPTMVHKVDGFVLCTAFAASSTDVYYAGTSRKQIYMFDKRRGSEPPTVAHNDAMVNSLCVLRDGYTVITGDSSGFLKTWDLRNSKSCLDKISNEATRKPISHVSLALRLKDEDDSRFLAVNSYDNVLRVYDRGAAMSPFSPTVVHLLKSHRNQNWPVRSSFFVGPEYTGAQPALGLTGHTKDGSLDDHEDSHTELATIAKTPSSARSLDQSLLLASGSADSYAYVYDVSGREGSSELLQRLEGHTDRVYTVGFHHTKPMLATGSADFTVRVWSARSKTSTIL